MRVTLRQFAVAAVLMVGAAAPGVAQAADVYNAPPPPAFDVPPPPPQDLFAGWFIGATLGGATADFDFSETSGVIDASGFLGGVTGGYNWQNGPIVIGLEGDVLASDVSGDRRFNGGLNQANPSIDTMADVRLRAGVTVVPQVLVFATLGAAWADASLDITGPGGRSKDGTFFGWSVGGGAEVALSSNWSARFDYQFTDFDSETVSYPGGDVNFDPDMSTYRGSLIYKF